MNTGKKVGNKVVNSVVDAAKTTVDVIKTATMPEKPELRVFPMSQKTFTM